MGSGGEEDRRLSGQWRSEGPAAQWIVEELRTDGPQRGPSGGTEVRRPSRIEAARRAGIEDDRLLCKRGTQTAQSRREGQAALHMEESRQMAQ